LRFCLFQSTQTSPLPGKEGGLGNRMLKSDQRYAGKTLLGCSGGRPSRFQNGDNLRRAWPRRWIRQMQVQEPESGMLLPSSVKVGRRRKIMALVLGQTKSMNTERAAKPVLYQRASTHPFPWLSQIIPPPPTIPTSTYCSCRTPSARHSQKRCSEVSVQSKSNTARRWAGAAGTPKPALSSQLLLQRGSAAAPALTAPP